MLTTASVRKNVIISRCAASVETPAVTSSTSAKKPPEREGMRRTYVSLTRHVMSANVQAAMVT